MNIIELNDWEFDDLKIGLKDMTLTQMQEKYIQKDEELTEKCLEYVKSHQDKDIEKECDKLYQEKLIIGMKIADRMTGVQSVL